MTTKTCNTCRESFVVSNRVGKKQTQNRKYCSHNCYKNAVFHKEKPCCVCDKVMVLPPHVHNQKFCSRKCKQDSAKNKDYKTYIRDNSVTDENGCWIWLKCYDPNKYPVAAYHRKKVHAHRLSYFVFKGDIPKGMHICHSCDIPGCVNPEHLWLGTPKDNVHDSMKKGRHRYQKKNTLECCNGGVI